MKKILILATAGLMVLGGCSEKEQPDSGAMVEEITIEESAGDESGMSVDAAMEAAEEAVEAADESEVAAEVAEQSAEMAEEAAEEAVDAAEDAADSAMGQ
jgi:hypothetical protein